MNTTTPLFAAPLAAPRVYRVAIVAAATLTLLLSACGDKKSEASQTAAKVNKEEITVHQINFVLQHQQGIKPEQMEAASHQVLERLIDQELAIQKAEDLKLDRDPRVVQQIEAAKREIIARAYAEQTAEAAPKPTAAEISQYYDAKPALFKERRIYSLQDLSIECKPEECVSLRATLAQAKTFADFVDMLKRQDVRFAANQAVRSAEQLPLANLDAIARLQDGQSMVTMAVNGMQVLYLQGSRSQPVDLAHATPIIEQYLWNQRKTELVTKQIKSLREAAKIEYVGKFAPGAASAPALTSSLALPQASDAGASSTAAPAAPTSSASGLDASSIAKGMGLK